MQPTDDLPPAPSRDGCSHRVATVERCPETNLFVGYIPGLAGAHSQGATLDELRANLAEVLELLGEGATIELRVDSPDSRGSGS